MKVLQSAVPAGNYSKLASMLNAFDRYALRYNVYGRLRMAAFFAQLLHESDGGKTTEEYASGRAYEFRKDLGNTVAGDGTLFKGRGYIQLTGRLNYQNASRELFGDDSLVQHPEIVASNPDIAMLVSLWFWNKKGLNALADKRDFLGITKKVNGGTNGLAKRQAYYTKLLAALNNPVANVAILSKVSQAIKALLK